jgi:hypothetical protein
VRGNPLVTGLALLLVAVVALGAVMHGRRHARRRAAPQPPPTLPFRVWRSTPAWAAPASLPEPPPAESPSPSSVTALRSLRVRPTIAPFGLRPRSLELALQRVDGDEPPAKLWLRGSLEGVFTIHWLEPGGYAATVETADLRPATFSWAGTADVVDLELRRMPYLLLAIGESDEECEMGPLQLTGEGRVTVSFNESGACQDGLSLPPGPTRLKVRVGDRDVDTTVSIPEDGDPAPLCLTPPCAQLPAALAVWVADEHRQLAYVRQLSWEGEGRGGTMGGAHGVVFLTGTPGERFRLRAELRDGSTAEATETLGFGVRDVLLTARP